MATIDLITQHYVTIQQRRRARLTGLSFGGGSSTPVSPNPMNQQAPPPIQNSTATAQQGTSLTVQNISGFYARVAGNPTSSPPQVSAIPMPPTKKKRAPKIKKVMTQKIVTLSDVILPENMKEEINAAIGQIHNFDLIYDTWGFNDVFEKGTAVTMLFYGLPGTGKTLAAQGIAGELGSDLKVFNTGDLQSSEPGGLERKIRKIFLESRNFFKRTDKHQVILLDECDSLLYNRSKVGVILGAQINALLQEIEKHTGVIILTTNRLGTLDPALERRITAKIEFPFPDEKARENIWKKLIPTKAPLAKDVDIPKLALYPIAGGNIKNVILNAARMAAYQKSKVITMDHFVDALEKESKSMAAFASEQKEHQYDGGLYMSGGDRNKVVV